eukprot:COSAG02_NODE_44650_length_364_cov_0.883019_1_plen_29_part_10
MPCAYIRKSKPRISVLNKGITSKVGGMDE